MTDVILRFNDQDASTIVNAFTGPGDSAGEFNQSELDQEMKSADSDVQGILYFESALGSFAPDTIYVMIDQDYDTGTEDILDSVVSSHSPTAPITPFSGEAKGTTPNPSTGSQSFVVLPEMTLTGDFSGNPVRVDFKGTFSLTSTLLGSDGADIGLFLDGSEVDASYRSSVQISGVAMSARKNADIHATIEVPEGNHTIDIRWMRTGTQATVTAHGTQRTLRVNENMQGG